MTKHARRIMALLRDMADELSCELIVHRCKGGSHCKYELTRKTKKIIRNFTLNANCNDGTNMLNAIRRDINKAVREGLI